MTNLNERPIFILGAHKSGSSLVRSLLDGHPELFVVPFETHFFQRSHYWVDYRLRRTRPPRLPCRQTREELIGQVERYNSISDAMSDSNLVNRFDMSRFRQTLTSDEQLPADRLFLNYIDAIHASLLGHELPADLRIVEKSVENAEFVLDLQQMFPGAKFIHVLRNPYANLVSLRRHVGRRGYPFLGPSLASLNNSHYNLYRNRRLVDEYLILRYEEIIAEPGRSMRQVADFLGIEYLDCLLEPTSMNRSWSGNSSRGIEFAGISSRNLDLWRDEINALEIHLINRLFEFLLEEYGYETLTAGKSRFLPNRGESVRIYLLNRLIPFYS